MKRAVAALTITACAAFVAHATWAWSRWYDDAFITFRYAERFAAGRGMTFNDGEPVEGLTNLGWALILSVFAPGDLLLAAKVLGLAAGVLTVGLLGAWCADVGLGLVGAAAALAALALVPWAPTNAVSGLETAAAMACATAGWSLAHRGRLAYVAAVAMGVGPWVRPDIALVPMVVAVRRWDRRAWVCAGIVLGLGAALVAVKLAWFGAVLPHTAEVKLRGRYGAGALYIGRFLGASPALGASLVASVAYAGVRRDVRALPGLLCGVWALAVVAQGGDFMANFRLLVPVLPAACAALGAGVDALAGRLRWLAVVPAVGIVAAARLDHVDEANQPTPPRVVLKTTAKPPGFGPFEEDGAFPVAWPVVNVGTGATSFPDVGLFAYVQDGPVVDPLGLTDPAVAGHVPGVDPWRSLAARVSWFVADLRGGVWADRRDELAEGGWRPVAGCGSIWVLANPALPDTPPDDATLEARLARLRTRAPRDVGLLRAVAWELAAAGRREVLDRWSRDLGHEFRCVAGLDGCPDTGACAGDGARLDAAAFADPATWPGLPANVATAPPRAARGKGCVQSRKAARLAWQALAEEQAGEAARLARTAGTAVRGPDAIAAAEAAADAIPGAEGALEATREAVRACGGAPATQGAP